MSDGTLDRLLAVQDLDTLITQLSTGGPRWPSGSGWTALEPSWPRWRPRRRLAARRAELVATQKDLEAQIAAINERRSGIEQRMYAARGSSTRDLQAMDEEVRT
jgi:hypothetical protein